MLSFVRVSSKIANCYHFGESAIVIIARSGSCSVYVELNCKEAPRGGLAVDGCWFKLWRGSFRAAEGLKIVYGVARYTDCG